MTRLKFHFRSDRMRQILGIYLFILGGVLAAETQLSSQLSTSEIHVGESPESVVRGWDNAVYVAVMGERLPAGGADGRIVVLKGDVAIPFAEGFRDPKGLSWTGSALVFTDIDQVWSLDQEGHRTLLVDRDQFPVTPNYLNDTLVMRDGSILVTDMGARDRATGTAGLWSLRSEEGRSFPAEGRIFRIMPSREVRIEIQNDPNLPCPNGLCLDPSGGFWVVDFFLGNVVSIKEDGSRVLARGLRGADGLATDQEGRLYVTQVTEGKVVQLTADGRMRTTLTAVVQAPADSILDQNQRSIELRIPDTKRGSLVTVTLPQPAFQNDGPLLFARDEIKRSASTSGLQEPNVEFVADRHLGEQAYRLSQPSPHHFIVAAGDEAGAMYGGLEIAERLALRLDSPIENHVRRPRIKQRGIKFNVPLDLRTPSYSDNGDSAQANIAEVWKRGFWVRYLDEMARSRYNVISLWNLHPFPSMVRVPEYPEIALNDVWRTRSSVANVSDDLGRDMVTPEMLKNYEVVHTLTMEEKIEFWRWVMEYARDRGISVYLFTWNVFTWAAEGHRGITADLENATTRDYFRASVRATLDTYPLLAGIGITAGENMPLRSHTVKEQWLWQTYGEGIRDALRRDPLRQFRLIHRYHWTNLKVILDEWSDYPGPFDLSYKYSVAHMYSIPNPPFFKPALAGLPDGYRVWLTLRNDDIYTFRAGDPDYTREYVLNMPSEERMGGFYMGSDGFCWGTDFLDREPMEGSRPLVIEKHWYNFMLWGRLSYDPALPNSFFERKLEQRFPEAKGREVRELMQSATQTMPLITRFFWGDIDIKWFPEACYSKPRIKGFYTVLDFMVGDTMPGANVLNIRDWIKRSAMGLPMEQTTPLEIANQLEATAAAAEASAARLRAASRLSHELEATIADAMDMAELAKYYADKIRGACLLAQYETHGDSRLKEEAVLALHDALAHWQRYAEERNKRYVPALYNRVGPVDLLALTDNVKNDIELARLFKVPVGTPSETVP